MNKSPNGYVIYRGPSQLDGAPIIVIATGLASNSRNTKTGAMVQTWIMREDISPIEACHTGADASICGDCRHRGKIVDGKNIDRSCYVAVFQAPRNVWESYHRGLYPVARDLATLLAGRFLRIGSYGDPAAVPLDIWRDATSRAAGWTGYTHQWETCPVEYAAYVMASADSPADRFVARAMGYRVFRVAMPGDATVGEREIRCPASKEAGQRTNCSACKACGGTSAKAKVDIVIQAHGSAAKIKAAKANLAA